MDDNPFDRMKDAVETERIPKVDKENEVRGGHL